MKRSISKDKGTPSQLLSALEGKIAQLEDSEVESATEVAASKKSFSHGTPSQLLSMLEDKISELEGTDIESSTSVMAEIDADDAFGLDRYIHNLIGSVNQAISENELFSGHTWDVSDDKSQIYLTVVEGDSSQEFAIPVEDLSRDFDNIDEDVDYIMNAIMPAESNGDQNNVSSSSTVEAAWPFDYEDEEPESEWEEIRTKSVLDSDGFYTDYTMYQNIHDGSFIFMFGDKDVYEPDRDYADYETDSEEVADEWFDSYEGFVDEDEDVYSASDTDPQISTYAGFEDYLTRSIESGMIDYAQVPPEDYDEDLDYSDEYEAFNEMCESFYDEYARKFGGKPYTISDPDEVAETNGAFAIVTVDGVDYELEGQGNMWRFIKR